MPPTRAILFTPPGASAIAVVRIHGPQARQWSQSHFRSTLRPGRAVHGILYDDSGNEIDDPLIYLAADETFADINLHGGAWVVRAVLELAKGAGFEIIERIRIPLPQEAIDSISIIQREIDAYLPLASTELALRTLLAQEQAWQNIDPKDHARILADHSLHWLLHPPRVAIVGAPNVGKSTLANRLFAQERSITADLPGTTRDWVGEIANLDDLAVQLVDTPGIRSTDDTIERAAIEQSEPQIRAADLIVLILDASRPLFSEQSRLIERFPKGLRVINKTDLAREWDLSKIEAIHTIGTSGEGIDVLMSRIRAHFGCDQIDPNQARCWTDRQRNSLTAYLYPGTPHSSPASD